jgi:hypothetical protein
MLIEHRPSHLTQGFVFPSHHAILGGVYGLENRCSMPKSWQKVSKREFLNPSHCHCRLLVWHLCASRTSTLRQDLEQNQTSPISPPKWKPKHTESSRPPQPGHTTSHPQISHKLGQKVHMEQLAWTFRHHIGEGWMASSFHLSMPTRRTHKILFEPQTGQSSNQIDFTQVRQKVKA